MTYTVGNSESLDELQDRLSRTQDERAEADLAAIRRGRQLDHHSTALVNLTTYVWELREAAQGVLDRMFSTYTARNGREVGIEADDGEKCWIVHSDDIEDLRRALAASPASPQASPTAASGDTATTATAERLREALLEIIAMDDEDATTDDLMQHDRNAGYLSGARDCATIARAALASSEPPAADPAQNQPSASGEGEGVDCPICGLSDGDCECPDEERDEALWPSTAPATREAIAGDELREAPEDEGLGEYRLTPAYKRFLRAFNGGSPYNAWLIARESALTTPQPEQRPIAGEGRP